MNTKISVPYGRWIILRWTSESHMAQSDIVQLIESLGLTESQSFISGPIERLGPHAFRYHVGIHTKDGYKRRFLDNKVPRQARMIMGLSDFVLEKRKSWSAVQEGLRMATQLPFITPDSLVTPQPSEEVSTISTDMLAWMQGIKQDLKELKNGVAALQAKYDNKEMAALKEISLLRNIIVGFKGSGGGFSDNATEIASLRAALLDKDPARPIIPDSPINSAGLFIPDSPINYDGPNIPDSFISGGSITPDAPIIPAKSIIYAKTIIPDTTIPDTIIPAKSVIPDGSIISAKTIPDSIISAKSISSEPTAARVSSGLSDKKEKAGRGKGRPKISDEETLSEALAFRDMGSTYRAFSRKKSLYNRTAALRQKVQEIFSTQP